MTIRLPDPGNRCTTCGEWLREPALTSRCAPRHTHTSRAPARLVGRTSRARSMHHRSKETR